MGPRPGCTPLRRVQLAPNSNALLTTVACFCSGLDKYVPESVPAIKNGTPVVRRRRHHYLRALESARRRGLPLDSSVFQPALLSAAGSARMLLHSPARCTVMGGHGPAWHGPRGLPRGAYLRQPLTAIAANRPPHLTRWVYVRASHCRDARLRRCAAARVGTPPDVCLFTSPSAERLGQKTCNMRKAGDASAMAGCCALRRLRPQLEPL